MPKSFMNRILSLSFSRISERFMERRFAIVLTAARQ
jgi:hypothetical protein